MERRAIRSYVVRAGRITAAQKSGLLSLGPKYTCDLGTVKDVDSLFVMSGPVHLEIGFGNADNLIESARLKPNTNHLGCEVHSPGIAQALISIENYRLRNVKVVNNDVHDLLVALGEGSLDSVDIFFPDPWPKKKHTKRRLIQAEFLELLATKLKRSGVFRFATDNAVYALEVIELIANIASWSNLAGEGRWAPRPNQRVLTRFEGKAKRQGDRIFEIAARCVIGEVQ